MQARRGRVGSRAGKASVRQLARPLGEPGDEAVTGRRGADAPVDGTDLLERVVEGGTLRRARHQVRRHQGAPGSDGMPVDALGAYGKTPGPTIRAAWLAGTSGPQPVRRTALPKAGGGTRHVGLPPGRDRCIEHARWQVLPEAWDPTCSERRSGCRPPHSAHHAVGPAQASIREGDAWVVDSDRERCVAQGNHDVWMRRVRRRVTDRRVLTVIHRFLQAGVLTLEGRVAPPAEGTPPGEPLTLPTKLQKG